jgi:hypothetical protein
MVWVRKRTIEEYHCYQLQTQCYITFFSQEYLHMWMKLLGIITVWFDTTDKQMISFLPYFEKKIRLRWDSNQLFIVCDVGRREVFYNISFEFVVPMKLVRLSKVCLNVLKLSKSFYMSTFVWYVSWLEWAETRRYFITFYFYCMKIQENHLELKLDGTSIFWPMVMMIIYWR